MNRPDQTEGQPGQGYIKPFSGAADSLPRRLEAMLFEERRKVSAEIRRGDTLGEVAAEAIIFGHIKDTEILRLRRLLARQSKLCDLRAMRRTQEKERGIFRRFGRGVERFFDGLGSVAVRAMEIMAETPQIDPASGMVSVQIPRNTKS